MNSPICYFVKGQLGRPSEVEDRGRQSLLKGDLFRFVKKDETVSFHPMNERVRTGRFGGVR